MESKKGYLGLHVTCCSHHVDRNGKLLLILQARSAAALPKPGTLLYNSYARQAQRKHLSLNVSQRHSQDLVDAQSK